MGARRLLVVLKLALPLALGACSSGTETGNPSISGALSYTGYSSAPLDYGVGDGGRVATVESAWFELGDVTVSPAGACGLDGGEAFSVPALGIGDHAAGNHNLSAFEATAGSFCSVELPFVRVAAGATGPGLPDELLGHAVVLAGKLADGTPFSIVSDQASLVQLSSESGGFALSRESPNTLVAFDFAAWLAGLDFTSASQDGGRIVISESSNSQLLLKFESNLASGIALYRDRDADGRIDSDPDLLARAK